VTKRLFTPGPLTTSPGVKRAMLEDFGSVTRNLSTWQARGTIGIESVISSAIPKDRGLLVLANGAYERERQAISRRDEQLRRDSPRRKTLLR
jgi:aspartate aminotransferase-like enzyme